LSDRRHQLDLELKKVPLMALYRALRIRTSRAFGDGSPQRLTTSSRKSHTLFLCEG
jgi:hypothetical protein